MIDATTFPHKVFKGVGDLIVVYFGVQLYIAGLTIENLHDVVRHQGREESCIEALTIGDVHNRYHVLEKMFYYGEHHIANAFYRFNDCNLIVSNRRLLKRE